jgi:CRP-like cAMP-binding protein
MVHASISNRVSALAQRARSPKGVNPADLSRKPEYLQAMQVFAPLSPDEWTWLQETTAMISCERGRTVYGPDDPGETLFFIKKGKVNLYRLTPDGRKLVTANLGSNSIFGEMGLTGQRMYGCFAEATEDCLLCVLSRSDMQALVRRNPDVGLLLLAEVQERFQQREAELESLAFRGLPARLAALLLREMDATGTVHGLSHQELAERLGTYRETVSQVLGRFRDEGLVAVSPRQIELLDTEGVRAYADPS